MKSSKYILIVVGSICCICIGLFLYISTSNNSITLTNEELFSLTHGSSEFVAGSVAIVPYDESIDSISLEEQIDIIANSSGAEIIIITTYEQSKLHTPKSLNIKVKRLMDSNKYSDELDYFEVNDITRTVLRGEIVEELFK